MGNRFFHLLMIAGLVAVTAACQARRNASDRVGMGYLSRANPNYSAFAVLNSGTAGQVSVGGTTDISNFFTNYINSDGSSFLLPCPIQSIAISGNVQAAVSSQGFGSTSIPSTGAQLHLVFTLGCMGRDPVSGTTFTNIDVDIADGTLGYVGASGWVSGGQANVSFQDEYGTISLVGMISGGGFSGTVTYANNYYYGTNGVAYSPGYTGTIGSFNIPCAGMFICQ